MIAVSLLLVVTAAALLVLGLWQPSNALLSGSIGASLVAAVLLVVGARRSGPPDDLEEFPDTRAPAAGHGREAGREADRETAGQRVPGGERAADLTATALIGAGTGRAGGDAPTQTIPQQLIGSGIGMTAGGVARSDEAALAVEDPPDEPPIQQVSSADAERVGRMGTEVLVVDGRPRYHLPGCVHLLGRDSEPLPVSEAIELGFTPCGLCEPDSALLADARRV